MHLNKINFGSTPYDFHLVIDKDLIDDDFKSSEQEFTDYFHRDSWQDILEKIVKMYVLKIDGKILGYVTLGMAHIRNDATCKIKDKEINGTIPALLISHRGDFKHDNGGWLHFDSLPTAKQMGRIITKKLGLNMQSCGKCTISYD